jgi:Mrp family chromosome partitioning ATPase
LTAAAAGALIGALTGAPTHRAEGHVRLGLSTHFDGSRPGQGLVEAELPLTVEATLDREVQTLRRLAGDEADDRPLRVRVQRDLTAPLRLTLSAVSPDPRTAVDAVQTILAAYAGTTSLHEDAEADRAYRAAAARLEDARSEAAAARARSAEAGATAAEATESDGPATDPEAEWKQLSQSVLAAREDAAALDRRIERLDALDPPTGEELAALDPEAETWLGRRHALDLAWVEAAWPAPAFTAERLTERFELTRQLQAKAERSRVVPISDGSLVFRAVDLDPLREEAASMRQNLATLESRLAEADKVVQRLRRLEATAERLSAEAGRQQAALARQRVGPGVELRETLAPDAAVVHRDTRPTLALAGASIGFGVGVLLAAGFFLLDPRVRRAAGGEALVGSNLPLLSSVPVVEESAGPAGDDAEPSTGVASIQSIRAVLEAQAAGGRSSFALTGVGAGSGTTSVAVGLAASMALAGGRVLLVDLAWMQKPAGTDTDDEATRRGLGVDGVIDELGYLEDEDRELIALGEDAETGFGALLNGRPLRRCVVTTRLPGLAVLGAMGRGASLRDRWAGRVSSRWLTKLIEVARRGGYATVIFDTGSAAGSVEGMLGCAAADGTLLVVSNDQPQSDYDKAVHRLRLVGATVIGTVLNRTGARRRGAGRGRLGVAATGSTTGSGIFAAAIEARSGGRDDAASDAAPLPQLHEAQASHTDPSAAVPHATTAEVPIAAGVDPIDEPPTRPGPTPARRPPATSRDAADAADAEQAPAASPQVHVTDDVMDQLVDHAIRTARRSPRSAEAPGDAPTAETPSPR